MPQPSKKTKTPKSNKRAPRRQQNKRKKPAGIRRAMAGIPKKLREMTINQTPNERKLAYYLMNPGGSPPMRLMTPGIGVPSTVLTLFSASTVTNPAYTGTYSQLTTAAGLYQVFCFRDVLRSYVTLSAQVAPYSYHAVFAGPTSTLSAASMPDNAGASANLEPLYYAWYSGAAPHGAALFCGRTADRAGYTWMDLGATMTLSRSAASPADQLQVFMYNPDGDVIVSQGSFALATYVFTVDAIFATTGDNADGSKGGYFRFLYTNGSAPSTSQTISMTLSNAATSDVFAHIACPNVLSHLNQLSAMRVNAKSMLIKNVAPLMNVGGTVTAVALGRASMWNDYIGERNLSGSSSIINTYTGALEKGLYFFQHFCDLDDLKFVRYATYDSQSSVLQSLSYPLEHGRIVAVTTAVTSAGATLPGLNFQLAVTSGLEFQTNDQWYNTATPRCTSAETQAAMDLVARHANQFFENPLHLSDISNFLSGVGRFARQHSGKLGAAMSALFPSYAPIFTALASRFSD